MISQLSDTVMNNPRNTGGGENLKKKSGIFEKQEPRLGILKSIFVLRSSYDH